MRSIVEFLVNNHVKIDNKIYDYKVAKSFDDIDDNIAFKIEVAEIKGNNIYGVASGKLNGKRIPAKFMVNTSDFVDINAEAGIIYTKILPLTENDMDVLASINKYIDDNNITEIPEGQKYLGAVVKNKFIPNK